MKTDVSEKGLEDIIVDHLVTANGYELGKSGFLAAILPMGEPMWENLSHFFRLLVPKLPSPDDPDLAKGVLDRMFERAKEIAAA